MKNFSKSFVFALTAACGIFLAPSQPLIAADTNTISAVKGDKLYTQFSLFYEKNVHRTTDYRTGTFVPINTEVTFIKANKNEIDVTLPDGTDLRIVNVEKYSGEKIVGILNRTLGKKAVDLSRFTKEEITSIQAGEVENGMSKDAVIASLGYPPKHETPTLNGNQWRYWRTIFTTFVVHFEDGKVVSIEQ
jgi:predicted nucleotidyltransferase component of viral defense system